MRTLKALFEFTFCLSSLFVSTWSHMHLIAIWSNTAVTSKISKCGLDWICNYFGCLNIALIPIPPAWTHRHRPRGNRWQVEPLFKRRARRALPLARKDGPWRSYVVNDAQKILKPPAVSGAFDSGSLPSEWQEVQKAFQQATKQQRRP